MKQRTARDLLTEFSSRYRVPAVGGGILTNDGCLDFDVVGVRRRDDAALAAGDDQWHIGSCGKSITAALYGRLVELGDAGWGVPVTELFGDLVDRIDPEWARRTIDEVFHCRAGMKANPSRSALKTAWGDMRPLPEQRSAAALSALRHPPIEPGRFVYSNLGYMVVGAAIDRLAGMSYEDTLRVHLLEPLGIESLGFGPPSCTWGHRPRIHLGSLAALPGAPVNPADPKSDNPPVLSSAGTMHMTLPDWAKFHQLFLTEGDTLLEPTTINRLLSVPPGGRMGMGWAPAQRTEGVSLGMQGSNTMWAATALIDEKRERTALVVCNDGRTRVLTQSARVAARLLNTGSGRP